MSREVDSGSRTFRIKGTPDSQGVYAIPVQWMLAAADVVNAGVEQYYESVQAWADSVLQSLRESEKLEKKSSP